MAIVLGANSFGAPEKRDGAAWQRLLDETRIPGAQLTLDRVTIEAGVEAQFDPGPNSLLWLQMFEGEGWLKTPFDSEWLSSNHSMLLPPEFLSTFPLRRPATLLLARVPAVPYTDQNTGDVSPRVCLLDWTSEHAFMAEHDARKRVFLVSNEFAVTDVFRADMVVFPPGSTAPKCRHEGAATFIYVTKGRGVASELSIAAGDVLYLPDGEWYTLKAEPNNELQFVEIYVPGKFLTVWANPAEATAWRDTGMDIHRRLPQPDKYERRIYARVFTSRT